MFRKEKSNLECHPLSLPNMYILPKRSGNKVIILMFAVSSRLQRKTNKQTKQGVTHNNT